MLGLVLLGEGPPGAEGERLLQVWPRRHAGEAGARAGGRVGRAGGRSSRIHVGIHHGLGSPGCSGQELLDRGDRRAAMPLLDRAIAQFGEALRIVPSYELSLRKIARAYDLKGDHATALDYEEGRATSAGRSHGALELAEALYNGGDFKASLAVLDQARRVSAHLSPRDLSHIYMGPGLVSTRPSASRGGPSIASRRPSSSTRSIHRPTKSGRRSSGCGRVVCNRSPTICAKPPWRARPGRRPRHPRRPPGRRLPHVLERAEAPGRLRRRRACRAALCSASFLLPPLPLASTFPSRGRLTWKMGSGAVPRWHPPGSAASGSPPPGAPLQGRLVVLPFDFAALEASIWPRRAARPGSGGGVAAVQVHRGDHRLESIGQERVLAPAVSPFGRPAETQVGAETTSARDSGEVLPAHEEPLNLESPPSSMSGWRARKPLGTRTDGRVARKLERLVVRAAALLMGVGRVGQGTLEQDRSRKRMADPGLEARQLTAAHGRGVRGPAVVGATAHGGRSRHRGSYPRPGSSSRACPPLALLMSRNRFPSLS